jgi:hypothetical protein
VTPVDTTFFPRRQQGRTEAYSTCLTNRREPEEPSPMAFS